MAYLPVIILFILFLIGVPVGISMLIAAFVYFAFINDSMSLMLVAQKMVSANESFTLLAVPFFVTIGSVMNYSGISKRLMHFCDLLTGHWTGGLAQVNVLLSTLLGGISGSASADAAMQCKILVPEMEKLGYDRAYSAAITGASSLISPIIPPGISLIVYATLTNASVGRMFIGGYVPGILMCIGLMCAVWITSKRQGYKPSRTQKASAKEILHSLKECIWALMMPFLIVFGIKFGVFTPTEGGTIIIVLCLFVGKFIYKELKWSDLPKILIDAAVSTCSIMLVIVSASVFSYYLSWERIPYMMTQAVVSVTRNPMVFLLVVNVFVLFLGMFLEGTAMLLIVVPLLYPIAAELGIDPIHFGFVIIVNQAIGGITPPFGSIMYLCSSACKVSIVDFCRKSWPFIIALLVVLLVITYCPQIVLWPVKMIYG